jgi:hypothetical protein
MIHMILSGAKGRRDGESSFRHGRVTLSSTQPGTRFVETFRIFSKLEVVTNEDRDRFISMLKETGHAYGNPIVKPDSGAYLGFAGHAY